MSAPCPHCKGERWICEQHPQLPWPHDDCAGPGIPCVCNADEEMPPGFIEDSSSGETLLG